METKGSWGRLLGTLLCSLLAVVGLAEESPKQSLTSYQAHPVAPSYDYELSGRKDRVKGYVVKIDEPNQLRSPGLVMLVSGVAAAEGYVTVNGHRYELPALLGELTGPAVESGKNERGKEGWYSQTSGDGIVGKVIVPVDARHLVAGLNEIEFLRTPSSDGFEIIDLEIQSVQETTPKLIGQTYHLLSRGRPATIRDFDFVFGYRSEKKRSLEQIPDWARRGKVNFYRAGIDWEHLDRMFEMFREARINLVAIHVPADTSSDEYRQVKAFIDRCHANDIRVTGFNSLGGLSLRDVLANPDKQRWISRDRYGNLVWRSPDDTFAADLRNDDYRKTALLKHAALEMDAGVDELYYDFSIGGTGDVLNFLDEVRQLAAAKGKNISIFGNCKGNILVDEVADLTKTEGTSEAGVWDGKWVHNIAQARFYYASGYGVKSYESKYEGADPGVPNPGAHDVRNGMKAGWRRPIAEASAFQSHFAIAEAGQNLLHGWIMKDDPLAVQTWGDISRYFTFLADHQDLYTDVTCVSNIGVISPPHIPSFEVSLKRDNLYNALAESNVMYEVLLLHRLTAEALAPYKAILIPNIPWMDAGQLAAIRSYKERGGKVYTIGSSRGLQDLADVVSPATMLVEAQKEPGRRELLSNIRKLAGDDIVSLPGSKYVAANVVRKTDSGRVILHLVNYDKPLSNVRVSLNLNGVANKIDPNRIAVLSPDGGVSKLQDVSIQGTRVDFVVPALDVYSVVTVN